MGWDRNCRALLKSARVKVSTEMFRDPKLLVEVHEWEKNASKNDPPDQLGRACCRTRDHVRHRRSETKERLEHFSRKQESRFTLSGGPSYRDASRSRSANVNRILGPRDWQKRRMPHKVLHNAFLRQSPQHLLCLESPVSFTPSFSPVVDAC